MYADSMLSHHKHGLPVENSTGTTEYLRLVNNKVGAGSILRVKTVTSGYSLQPQHFHLIDSDAKYLYDVEVLIKMRHSDAYAKLQEVMTDFPITCLLQRIELQKLLLDIVGSAVTVPNSTVNGHIDHSDGNSTGHVTPLLAVKSLVAMFKKAAAHLTNEMTGHLTSALPVCSSEGAAVSHGSELDEAAASMAEDNRALVYAIYKLRYPVYFSAYHTLACADKSSARTNSKVFNVHAKSPYFPSLPGYAFAICAATVKLLKLKHTCPSVFVEGGGAGVSSRELVLAVYSSVAREVLPHVLEPTSLLHSAAGPLPLNKVEADRLQYLLSAINEVVGYHGVDALLQECFGVPEAGGVALIVVKYFALLLSSIPLDRAGHINVAAATTGRAAAPESGAAARLDLYYDDFVVALLRRVCGSVPLRQLLAGEPRHGASSCSVLESLDRLLLTLDPDYSAALERAQTLVSAFKTIKFFVRDEGDATAGCAELRALQADSASVGSLPALLSLYELVVRRVWLACDHLQQEQVAGHELDAQLQRDLGVSIGCLLMISATIDSVCWEGGDYSLPTVNAMLLPEARGTPTCSDVMLAVVGHTLALAPAPAQHGAVEAIMSLCPSLQCRDMRPDTAIQMSRVASRYNFDLPSSGAEEGVLFEPDTFDLLYVNASAGQVLLLAERLLAGCLREFNRGVDAQAHCAAHLGYLVTLACKVLQFYLFQFLTGEGEMVGPAHWAAAAADCFVLLLPLLQAVNNVVLVLNLDLVLPSQASEGDDGSQHPTTLVISQCISSIEDLCLGRGGDEGADWAEFYYRCVGLELFCGVAGADREATRLVEANRHRYEYRLVYQLLQHTGADASTPALDRSFLARLCDDAEGASSAAMVVSGGGSVFSHDKLHALASIAFCDHVHSGGRGGPGVGYSAKEKNEALYQLVFLLSGENPSCQGLLRSASATWCVNVFRYCVESADAHRQAVAASGTDAGEAAGHFVNSLMLAELLLRELQCVRDCCSVHRLAGRVDITPLFRLLLLPSPEDSSSGARLVARFLAGKCVQYHCMGALQPEQVDMDGALTIPQCYKCVYGNLTFEGGASVGKSGRGGARGGSYNSQADVAQMFREVVLKLPVLRAAPASASASASEDASTSALVLELWAQQTAPAGTGNYFEDSLRLTCAFVKNPARKGAAPALGVIQQLIEQLQHLHGLVAACPSTMVPLILTLTVTEPVEDPTRLLLLDSLRAVLTTVPPCQVTASAVNDNIILNLVLALLTLVVQHARSHSLVGPRAELSRGVEMFCRGVFECLVGTLLPAKCSQILAGAASMSAGQRAASCGNYTVNTSIPYESHESLADSASYYSSSLGAAGGAGPRPAVIGRQLSTRRPNNVSLERRVVNEELVKAYNEGQKLSQARSLGLFCALLEGAHKHTQAQNAAAIISAERDVCIPALGAALLDKWLREKTDAAVAGDASARAGAQRCLVMQLVQIATSEREATAARELCGRCLHAMCAASGPLVWRYLQECDRGVGAGSSATPLASSLMAPTVVGAAWSVQMLVRVVKHLRMPDSVRGSAMSRWCLLLLVHLTSSAAGPCRHALVTAVLASCRAIAKPEDEVETDQAPSIHCDSLLDVVDGGDDGSACGVYAAVTYDWTWIIHLLHSRLNASKCLALELVYNICGYFMHHRARMGGEGELGGGLGGEKCASVPWNLLTAVQNCVTSNVTSVATPAVECAAVRAAVLRVMYAVFQHPSASVRVLDYPMDAHGDTERTTFDSGVCTILAQIAGALSLQPSDVHSDAPVLRTDMQHLQTHVDVFLHLVVTQCARPGADATRVLAACKDLKLFPRAAALLSASYFGDYLEQVKAKLLRNMYHRPAQGAFGSVGCGVDGTGWDRAFAEFAAEEHSRYVKICTAVVRLFQFLCSSNAQTNAIYVDSITHSGLFASLLDSLRTLQEAASGDAAFVGRDWLVLCTVQYDLICATVSLVLGPGPGPAAAQVLPALRHSAPELLALINFSIFNASSLLIQLLVSVCQRDNEAAGVASLFGACATLCTSCLRLLTSVTGLLVDCPRPALQSCFLALLMLRRVMTHYASSLGGRESGSSQLSMDSSIFSAVSALAGAVPVVQGALQMQVSVAMGCLLQRCRLFPYLNDYSFGVDTLVVERAEEAHPELLAGLLLARNLECAVMAPIASAAALVGEISQSVIRETLDGVYGGAEALTEAQGDVDPGLSPEEPAPASSQSVGAAASTVNKKQLTLLKSRVPLHLRGTKGSVLRGTRALGQTTASNSTTIPRSHSSSFASPAVCYSRTQLRRSSGAQSSVPMVSPSRGSVASSSPSSVCESLSPADVARGSSTATSKSSTASRRSAVASADELRRLYMHLLVLQSVLPLASPEMKDLICTPHLVHALHQLILISRPWGLAAHTATAAATAAGSSATAGAWTPTNGALFTAVCATVAAVLHRNPTMKAIVGTLSCAPSHSAALGDFQQERAGGALFIHHLLGMATAAGQLRVHPFVRRFYLSLVYGIVGTGSVVSISQKSALSMGVIRHLHSNMCDNTHGRLQPECVLLFLDALTAMVCNSSEYTNTTAFGQQPQSVTADTASVVSTSTYGTYGSYNRQTKMKQRNAPRMAEQQKQQPSSAAFVERYLDSGASASSGAFVPLPELLDMVLESYLEPASGSSAEGTQVNNFLITTAVLKSIGKIALTSVLSGNRRMLTVATHEKCLGILLQAGWLDSLRALLKHIAADGVRRTASDVLYYGSTCLMTALTAVWLLINNNESTRSHAKRALGQYDYKLLYRHMNTVILHLSALDTAGKARCGEVAEVISRAWISIYQLIQ